VSSRIPFEKAPFSQACENNKEAILAILKDAFANVKNVLEIGSGTGQHAVHFAKHLPHVQWHCADQSQYHDGILAWIQQFPSPNLVPPITLKVPQDEWPAPKNSDAFDAYFSANTAHIMQKTEARYLMQTINENLPEGGVFCQYGPFTQDGEFSSQSNEDFHHRLISEGYGGYRDIQELIEWAPLLNLSDIIQMPANNLMLIWYR
jgi:cyclopropane fatty-acyl-phospholipid synthase-like methyltransferase